MRIIFLNAWYARIEQGIRDFIVSHAPHTDVFCFQEVSDPIRRMFEELLPNYHSVYVTKFRSKDDDFELATYVRKELDIVSSSDLLTDIEHIGLGVCVELKNSTGNIYIGNVHGASSPGDKLDNEARLLQSQLLVDFFRPLSGRKIIGGDFNLAPETRSVAMFAENGYKNLIKENMIATTRNHLAWDKYPVKQFYSDYIFVNSAVRVEHFEVIENEVSDHLPLVLDIETNIPTENRV